ncbi:MAG: ABC transporter ATP-binding protein, partial [Calditrichaceae bacterium]
MGNIIGLENIGFSFNGKPVVKVANFSVDYGEFVGIIGPNGAGKTTLLKLMAGLLAPDEGRIELAGKNIGEFSRKKIAGILGYVPQTVDLAFSFSVREVVMMGRFPHQHGLLHIDADAGEKIN